MMATKKRTKPEPEVVTPERETAPDPARTEAETKEVRVIERIIENREIAPQDAFGKLTRAQINLIKNTVAKGASDDELKLFIQVCKGAQLNPFLRQVHLVRRWDSKLGHEVGAIQVGIDGFRAIAESTNQYAGNDDPIFDGEKDIEYGAGQGRKKTTVPVKATVTVHKLMAGERMPFTATARWDEYYPGEKMGFQWHIRPYLMLGKCAEALALRKAFPKQLSGMYAAEELERDNGHAPAAQRADTGFKKLMDAIGTSSVETLEDYIKRIEASDKYTAAQKKEFIKAANARIDAIVGNPADDVPL